MLDINKNERIKIKDLNSQLKKLKQSHNTKKIQRKEKKIKIKTEINDTENRKAIYQNTSPLGKKCQQNTQTTSYPNKDKKE